MTTTDRRLSEAHGLASRFFAIADRARESFGQLVGDLGLTPVQARAVLFLERPRPMRELAEHLACDASNVTGVADRLAAQGLVERVAGDDRRVRLLQLTERGAQLRARLAEVVSNAPSPADKLSRAERAQLIRLLDKMLG